MARALLGLLLLVALAGCGGGSDGNSRAAEGAPPPTPEIVVDESAVPVIGAFNSGCAAIDIRGGETVEVPCEEPAAEGRVIAELDLEEGHRAQVVSFEAGKGPCWEFVLDDMGPELSECFIHDCGAICALWTRLDRPRGKVLIAGSVPAVGEILVVRSGDQTERYALDGPLVPGLADQRIFMLALRAGPLPELDVLQGERILATWKPFE